MVEVEREDGSGEGVVVFDVVISREEKSEEIDDFWARFTINGFEDVNGFGDGEVGYDEG